MNITWKRVVQWYQNETNTGTKMVLDALGLLALASSIATYLVDHLQLGNAILLAVLALVLLVGGHIAFSRIDSLRSELVRCHAFETQFISCMQQANSIIKPVVVIKEIRTHLTVEANGDLDFYDLFEITNGGLGKPPIIWFAWEVAADADAPSFGNLARLKTYGRNVRPANLALGYHVQQLNDRAFREHFMFPEPVETEPRQFEAGYRWPDNFKNFLKTGKDTVGFDYTLSPYQIEKLRLTVRFAKKLGPCSCTRSISVGEIRSPLETTEVDPKYTTWIWQIDNPVKGTPYMIDIRRG